MKQGKSYFTVIVWILLAAIVAYFTYSVVSSLYAPLLTVTVTQYEAGAGCYATGFVVRQEELIYSDYDTTVITCSEGMHVASSDVVAIGYQSEEARTRQARIDELTAQIEQLEFAWNAATSAADQAALDAQISNSLVQYVRYLSRRDMNSLDALSSELKGYVLRRTSSTEASDSMQQKIEAFKAELATLRTQAASDTSQIRAGGAGTFSASVDGYEYVLTPELLDSVSTQEFSALTPDEPDERAIGKLITGMTWYFACTLPSSELKDVHEGDRVTLTFARDYYQPVSMRVRRVGDNEGGYRILVLSSDTAMQNITMLRMQSADVVFTTYNGLRVPKDAVRVENGQTGVYVLEGTTAKWKPITILHDTGESYIVELDKSSTGNLWPGDELIINAKNLYNGKVVS